MANATRKALRFKLAMAMAGVTVLVAIGAAFAAFSVTDSEAAALEAQRACVQVAKARSARQSSFEVERLAVLSPRDVPLDQVLYEIRSEWRQQGPEFRAWMDRLIENARGRYEAGQPERDVEVTVQFSELRSAGAVAGTVRCLFRWHGSQLKLSEFSIDEDVVKKSDPRWLDLIVIPGLGALVDPEVTVISKFRAAVEILTARGQ